MNLCTVANYILLVCIFGISIHLLCKSIDNNEHLDGKPIDNLTTAAKDVVSQVNNVVNNATNDIKKIFTRERFNNVGIAAANYTMAPVVATPLVPLPDSDGIVDDAIRRQLINKEKQAVASGVYSRDELENQRNEFLDFRSKTSMNSVFANDTVDNINDIQINGSTI